MERAQLRLVLCCGPCCGPFGIKWIVATATWKKWSFPGAFLLLWNQLDGERLQVNDGNCKKALSPLSPFVVLALAPSPNKGSFVAPRKRSQRQHASEGVFYFGCQPLRPPASRELLLMRDPVSNKSSSLMSVLLSNLKEFWEHFLEVFPGAKKLKCLRGKSSAPPPQKTALSTYQPRFRPVSTPSPSSQSVTPACLEAMRFQEMMSQLARIKSGPGL